MNCVLREKMTLPNLGFLSVATGPRSVAQCDEVERKRESMFGIPNDIARAILLKTDIRNPYRVKIAQLTLCRSHPEACEDELWKAMLEQLLGRPLVASFKASYLAFVHGLPDAWLSIARHAYDGLRPFRSDDYTAVLIYKDRGPSEPFKLRLQQCLGRPSVTLDDQVEWIHAWYVLAPLTTRCLFLARDILEIAKLVIANIADKECHLSDAGKMLLNRIIDPAELDTRVTRGFVEVLLKSKGTKFIYERTWDAVLKEYAIEQDVDIVNLCLSNHEYSQQRIIEEFKKSLDEERTALFLPIASKLQLESFTHIDDYIKWTFNYMDENGRPTGVVTPDDLRDYEYDKSIRDEVRAVVAAAMAFRLMSQAE